MYRLPRRTIPRHVDDAQRIAWARALWDSAQLADSTPVATYLRDRGIALDPLPISIRYAPALRHPSGTVHPAMVCTVVDGAGMFRGVHRTFLQELVDGSVGKADVVPCKMSLGPVRGCAVRLPARRLGAGDAQVPKSIFTAILVCEGIEDGLTLYQAFGRRREVWAALGVSNLGQLVLPAGVREVVIAADSDSPGKAAALQAAYAYQAQGRFVRIAYPPDGLKDFNEVLKRG